MFTHAIKQKLQRFDWILFFCIFILFLFGFAAIYSVELSLSGVGFIFVKKQLFAFSIGIIALILITGSNYLLLRYYGRGLYIAGLILMVLVLIFGRELNGTTGWFIFFGLSFQPVEFMKIALAVQLARYFGEHARRRFGWREIIGSGFLTAIPVFLTILQPDLGSALLLVGLWLALLLFAGIRMIHVSVLFTFFVITSTVAWGFFLQDYQKERIQVFMNPSLDPLESGYNITQAKIAIGSGQLFGRGLGFGSQSQLKFLPESQTDFIFAVIAEELGFLGVVTIILLFGILLWRILVHVHRARDSFSAFLVATVFCLFFVQMAVNVGVNLAIFPTTGVALPFVSYGGTSLVMSLVLVGVVESVCVREIKVG